MKLLNKLLMITGVSSVVVPSLLVVSCNKVVDSSPNSELTNEQINDFINSINSEQKLKEVADITFKTKFGSEKTLSNTLPSEVEESPSSLKISFKETKYKENISVSVNNANTEKNASTNISNTKGEVTIFIEFLNRKENKSQNKKMLLTGLMRNSGFDHNNRQETDPTASFGGREGLEKYDKADQKQRFNIDNEKYIKILESMYTQGLSKNVDIKKEFGLDLTEEQIEEFNKLAEEVSFDSYYNSALKGFTLPVFEDNKKKLKINDRAEVNKGPSFTDSLGSDHVKSHGLARTLTNQTYKTMAEQTFQVKFTYKKDFSVEIANLKKNIEIIRSWDENKFKEFKDGEVRKLELQYNFEIQKLQQEINSIDSKEKARKAEKENELQDLKNKLEKEKSEILAHTKISLIKSQQDELNKLIEKREQGKELANESGTMWIMDYQLDNANSPTTFYFGTNSHVAKAITDNLTRVSITRIKESVKIGQTLKLNSFDPNFETFTFEINDQNRNAVSAIFHATDFIDKKPADYLVEQQAEKYKDAGFFADFAVVEFDFNSLLNNSNFTAVSARKEIDQYKSLDAKKLSAIITNNYATKGNYVKFKSDSYLTDYEKVDRPILIKKDRNDKEKLNNLESIYVLGYPTSESDYYLRQHLDDDQISEKKNDFSLWTNSDSKYFDSVSKQEGSSSLYSDEELARGNFLSYQIGYRSFTNKPGLTDAFLATHRVGNELYTLTLGGKTKQYFNFGLELMPRFYSPAGGASGSSVRNKNNELIAVYHASNGSAKTGLATMFRSPGYNYQGLFGEYNLPEYDLIYGSGQNQINSYRHALEKKFKDSNIKTKLFENGFSINNIPDDFKFDKKTN
ncbi:Ig-specific serine endopeptidase MIP [Mycoplasma yeatsii]|uniref:Ig-specific serine endopeptidase MIP n=1 Tax=Mycoplasma yeatsii TaxID=51365 RepID=UPI0005B24E1E|nr:hypothetical protein [Mycoplasma yeatsii]AJM72090.1 LppD family lipoprotein [Mycoplasma yeatsii GM274B]